MQCCQTCAHLWSCFQDFFPTYEMKPNPSCSNLMCRDRQVCALPPRRKAAGCDAPGCDAPVSLPQAKREAFLASPEHLAAQAAAAAAAALEESTAAPLHADNEWNISVIGALVNRCASG